MFQQNQTNKRSDQGVINHREIFQELIQLVRMIYC